MENNSFQQWILAIHMVLTVFHVTLGAVQDCPLSCECSILTVANKSGVNIVCTGFTQITASFPVNTVRLELRDSQFDGIPINAFLKLDSLRTLVFNKTELGTIRACSLAEFKDMDAIEFERSAISLIEGNAFSNLENIGRISFREGNIREIMSFAFHNLTQIGALEFTNTNITYIHRFAFRKMNNVGQISFSHSAIDSFLGSGFSLVSNISVATFDNVRFETLQCDTLETLAKTADRTRMSNLTFTCNCNLAWMWREFKDDNETNRESPFTHGNGKTCN